MAERKSPKRMSSGEELGLKLLKSVPEMKAGQATRTLIRIAGHHPEVVREALA